MSNSNHITASCVISQGTVYRNEEVIFEQDDADTKDFLTSLYHHLQLNYPKFYKMDRLSKLGWLAAEVLLSGKGSIQHSAPAETGVVISNANASLDADMRYYDSVKAMPSPALFVYTLPNIMIGEICIRNHFKGENAFFVSDSFDIPFMQGYVADLLDRALLKTCICGWVELMGPAYEAVLYRVEHLSGSQPDDQNPRIIFTDENIKNIYSLKNG